MINKMMNGVTDFVYWAVTQNHLQPPHTEATPLFLVKKPQGAARLTSKTLYLSLDVRLYVFIAPDGSLYP